MTPDFPIAIVGPLPPPAGGMATQTMQLVNLLRGEQRDVRLVQTNQPYRPAFIGRIRGLRAVFRLIRYIPRVWKIAGEVKVIHLMANSGWSWQLFAAPVLWIGWARRTPVIVNYRGGLADEYLKRSFARVRPSISKAASVVVPSEYLRNIFAGYGIRTEVIPNIVNVERFQPRETGEDSDPFTIIITRNLEAIYGIDTALRAVASVSGELSDWRLLIAGSGPRKEELEQLARQLGVDGQVTFLGQLQPEQISDLYKQADLLLNPSNVDNMPNSLLEAMASGVPIVTTDVGGIPYMVENERTALMVPPADSEQMASKIIRLYREPETRKRLKDNGLFESQKYAWPAVRDHWLQLYKRIERA